MKEARWLSTNEARLLLNYPGNLFSRRKTILVAAACCRRAWDLLVDPRSKRAVRVVEATEQFVDGLISYPELKADCQRAWGLTRESTPAGQATEACAFLIAALLRREQAGLSYTMPEPNKTIEIACRVARQALDAIASPDTDSRICDLLRDCFGNPWRLEAVSPSWLTWNDSAVRRLARHIYEERAFGDMPVLADALEEAGCTYEEMLAHCRRPVEHIRGCWVLDLLLGKE
jgi:hypothetical protein